METTSLAPLPVAVPFIVAGFTAMTRNWIPGRFLNVLAILTAAFVASVGCVLFIDSWSGRIVYWFGGWRPRGQVALGIAFAIDPAAAFFTALTAFLFLASLVFSSRYFDDIRAVYQVLMLSFLGAMCGFSLTGDLFNLFVFFELMSVAGFALCAYQTEERGPVQGSLNFAITNTIGGFMILSGIGLLYGRTGALNMAQIGLELDRKGADSLVLIAFLLMLAGFYVKAGIVPFHFWVADAHAVAPTPVCILFSGVMDQLGIYGLLRVYWAVFAGPLSSHSEVLLRILIISGAATAIVGGVMCLAERNIKRLLAFSTVSHMGILLCGFGMFDWLSAAGAAVYVLAHALFKSSLFFGTGILRHRFSTVDEMELRGKGRIRETGMLLTAVTFIVGGLGLASLPPLGLFLGQSMMDEQAKTSGYEWLTFVAMTAGALTGAAVLRVAGRVFLGWGRGARDSEQRQDGEGRETQAGGYRVPWVMLLPPLTLTAFGVALGVLPGVASISIHSAQMFANHSPYVRSVLGGPLPHWLPLDFPWTGLWRGAATAGLAVALAGCWLAGPAIARGAGIPPRDYYGRAVRVLRSAHSGHAGDYVTWITIGTAMLGVLFLTLLR